jgi:hypothetical protein
MSEASHRIKLSRAREHQETLNEHVRRYLNGHRTRTEIDPQASEARAHLVKPDEPPWGPVIGDCLYNLRSVLDHIVFELAEAASPSPLPKKIAESSMWPVAKTPSDFNKGGIAAKRVQGVSPGARTIIEDLQPYKYTQGSVAGLVEDPILVLDKLANIDKHRALHLVTVNALAGIGGIVEPRADCVLRGPVEWCNPETFENDAVLGRVPIEITGPSPKVNMGAQVEFFVVLNESTALRWDIVDLIQHLIGYIERTVLPSLEALL